MSGVEKKKQLFVSATELMSRTLTVEYLIDGILECGTIGQIFGPPGKGKTFVALDVALSIASGNCWAGRRTTKGLVIYFCAEGRAGIPRRIKAWLSKNNCSPKDVELFHITEKSIELCGPDIDKITLEIAKITQLLNMEVALIVIDTLAQHMPSGSDENTTKDMSIFLRNIERLKDSYERAVVMIIHHSGHNTSDRARGSSSLKAALDFEIKCDSWKLVFSKMKDAEAPNPLAFRLNSLSLGNDVASAYVEYIGCSENVSVDYGAKLTKYENVGLETLNIAIIMYNSFGSTVGILSANLDIWRDLFYRSMRSNNNAVAQNTLKTQFNRVNKSLLDKNIISIEDKLVRLLNDKHFKGHSDNCNLDQTAHGA